MENNEVKPMKLKKGFWKPEEDMILKRYVEAHGEGNWATISQKSGLTRGAKSCRLRWKNYLRPNIKHGRMSQDEVDLIIRMHKLLGNRWSLIAGRLPGRTDNEVKNYWNTHLNKKSRQQTQHNGTASAAITAATTNTDRNQDRTKDPAHTPTRKAHNQVWDKKTENTKILAEEPAWMELDEQSFLRRADTGYSPSMPGYINNACSGTLLTCDNEEQMASLTTTDVSVFCDAFGCHWEETYLDDCMQLWDDLK